MRITQTPAAIAAAFFGLYHAETGHSNVTTTPDREGV